MQRRLQNALKIGGGIKGTPWKCDYQHVILQIYSFIFPSAANTTTVAVSFKVYKYSSYPLLCYTFIFCQIAQMPSFKQEFNCQKTRKTNLDFYRLPLLSQEISKSWSSQTRLEGVHNGNLERGYMIVSQVTITF